MFACTHLYTRYPDGTYSSLFSVKTGFMLAVLGAVLILIRSIHSFARAACLEVDAIPLDAMLVLRASWS